eukprot:Skav207057  [mRNA]  locus=scaffold709:180347:180589:- [translate_table: standard]
MSSSRTITAPSRACASAALKGPCRGFSPTSSAFWCWFSANKQIQNTMASMLSTSAAFSEVILCSAHKRSAVTVLAKSWPQ